MRSHYIELARLKARELVFEFGATAPNHIELAAYARARGITRIEIVPLDGAGSQLVCAADLAVIQISDRLIDPDAIKFATAHELGHNVLQHPVAATGELCTRHRSRRDDESQRDYEAEADAFAGELLMPIDMVAPLVRSSATIDFRIAREIARVFRVSILASSIRYVELSTERCAAVFAKAGRVKWIAKSPTFGFDLERRTLLSCDTLASSFFETGALTSASQRLAGSAWFPEARGTELVEHAISSTEHETTLSILWFPQTAARGLASMP
jgi:Zn-dependent peptidase ImmA (M78 family)